MRWRIRWRRIRRCQAQGRDQGQGRPKKAVKKVATQGRLRRPARRQVAVKKTAQEGRQESPDQEGGEEGRQESGQKGREEGAQAPPLAARCGCLAGTLRVYAARSGESAVDCFRGGSMAHAKASIGTVDYATAITTGHHRLTADEGPELGGKDAGPAPYDLLTSALGACTVITLRMYAERKQWPVTAVHADIHFKREGQGREHRPRAPYRGRRRRRAEEAHGRDRRAHAGDAHPQSAASKSTPRSPPDGGTHHENRIFNAPTAGPLSGARSADPSLHRRGVAGLRLRDLQRPCRHPDRHLLALPLQRDRRIQQPGQRRAQRAADRARLRRRPHQQAAARHLRHGRSRTGRPCWPPSSSPRSTCCRAAA